MNSTDLMPTPAINPFDDRPRKNVVANFPAEMFSSYNFSEAFNKGTDKNWIFNAWGGLGDQVCAEPAIRFALNNFKGIRFSLAARCPSVYSHLNFSDVFDTRKDRVDWDKYLTFQTITSSDHINWEFMTHLLMHAVDYPSVSMFRFQLPNEAKEIHLPNFRLQAYYDVMDYRNAVVIHAGRSWASKTFPAEWWNEVIKLLKERGFRIVLVGATITKNIGYVDVDSRGCIDWRDQLTIPEFITVLKKCKYLLSNDSAAIHIAAAGDAFIGMVATVKRPDYITHWRKGEFGYKTKNFGRDGIWNYMSACPVSNETLAVDHISTDLMQKILPPPVEVAGYYAMIHDAYRHQDLGD